jgi:hypothetical protein
MNSVMREPADGFTSSHPALASVRKVPDRLAKRLFVTAKAAVSFPIDHVDMGVELPE